MDTEPGSQDYAKQKLCDAVYALIGSSTIDRRLTYAASYLMLLQSRDLPAGMRDDFEKLLKKLTRIPLSSATSPLPRPISEDDALELAKAILSTLVQLLGGLVDDQASVAGPIVDREEGAPSEFENMGANELAAALMKMMADHGLTVSAGDADKPRSPDSQLARGESASVSGRGDGNSRDALSGLRRAILSVRGCPLT